MSPFDATANLLGTVFFTGISVTDGTGRVFSVTPPLTTVTKVSTDSTSPFVLPLGIAMPVDPLDTNVYVADPAATTTSGDVGAIFTVSQTGGSSNALSGTVGYQPRGLTIASIGLTTPVDTIYFTGNNPNTGEANVFSVDTTGASPTPVLASPSGLNDPSGVSVDVNGNVFVVDQAASGSATIFEIASNTNGVSTLATGLQVGFPAGIAVSSDATTLYVSGRSVIDGTDVIIELDATTGSLITTSTQGGINAGVEAGGLHLAVTGQVDFVDGLAGGTGTVYQITP